MSSLLNTVLQYTQPDYWDATNYQNVRFKKFALSANSHEYINIRNEFLGKFGSNCEITEISRIQHPYAYASCQIRRKQLSVINSTGIPAERRIYLRVKNVNQIAEFLEYNCDERKAACVGGPLPASGCVVMAKEIAGESYNTRSSNKYPDYLINYRPRGSETNLDHLFSGLRLH